MQLATDTAEGWANVIADLTLKRQRAQEHVEQLRAHKRDLALEAGMGSDVARKELAKINAELARLAVENEDLDAAVARAESEKGKAVHREAGTAERQRREQIAQALGEYRAEARKIDDGLRTLAERFAAAKQSLDRASALMTNEERAPFNQVPPYSLFGSTLAAAYFDLGEYLNLGREAAHFAQRQTLESFTAPFLEPWTKGKEVRNGEPQNK